MHRLCTHLRNRMNPLDRSQRSCLNVLVMEIGVCLVAIATHHVQVSSSWPRPGHDRAILGVVYEGLKGCGKVFERGCGL